MSGKLCFLYGSIVYALFPATFIYAGAEIDR